MVNNQFDWRPDGNGHKLCGLGRATARIQNSSLPAQHRAATT
jgi:hypothetical protein